jgi:hypothetical protein
MQTQTSDAVLDKIGKLLAMANNDGASENERNQAQDHVQRLLQFHNLSLSQVENHSGKPSVEKREKAVLGSAVRPWQVTIMQALAKSNFCLHQVSMSPGQGQPRRHFIIGRAVNTEATRLTYEYLLQALRRELAAAGYTETEPRVTSRGTKYSKEGQWFLEGAANRLQERLVERRRQAERESREAEAARQAQGNGSGKELILTDVYGSEADLNNDALNNFPPGTTAAKRRTREEEEMKREAKKQELIAAGVEPTEALYRSYGYSIEQAQAWAADVNKPSRSRGRGGRGRTQNWTRGDRSHYRMINSEAYQSGKSVGGSISLDKQVGKSNQKRLTH